MSTSTITSKLDTLTNLLTLLPSGTYLAFSTVIPIIANNGNCNLAEKGVVAFLFTLACAFSSFTDSFSPGDVSVLYGVVTTKGMWNPSFASYAALPDVTRWTNTGGGTRYTLKLADFFVAFLSVISFVSLTLLSSNLVDCLYPGIDGAVVKSIPFPVIFFVGLMLSFAPPARHSIGFACAKTTTSVPSSTSGATSGTGTGTTTARESLATPYIRSALHLLRQLFQYIFQRGYI